MEKCKLRIRDDVSLRTMSSPCTLCISNIMKNSVFLLALFTVLSAMSMNGRPECQLVQLPMCASMPYNLTRMPNLLHHSTQENAKLAIEQFLPLVNTNCSGNLTFFLCAMYAPICTMGFMEEPVPPCKSICQNVRAGCEPIMVEHNVSWPEYLSCDQLPEYTSGVCITRDAIVDSGPTMDQFQPTPAVPQVPPGNCDACQYDYELSRDLFFEKEYEFVIRARVEGFFSGTRRGEMYIRVIIHHVVQFSEIHIPVGEVQLWVNNYCACPMLTPGEEYMIMCYQDIINGRLLLENDCLAIPWQNRYSKRVKKWGQKLLYDQRYRDSSDSRSNRRNRDLYYLYG
ncbi:secreted frizzled-related protein 3-like [Lytechinus pictus]|uniref:secreted frizzled-related protein 3-like n=1 Tax=Lytechinus pictus TaxID=7653 RepID=UPI00240DB49A|nr:secreted frizzled-related protein 3-like [Lytechinus pictus]